MRNFKSIYLTKGEYSTAELKEAIERAMRHSSSPVAPE
jgi:hypothetical protein